MPEKNITIQVKIDEAGLEQIGQSLAVSVKAAEAFLTDRLSEYLRTELVPKINTTIKNQTLAQYTEIVNKLDRYLEAELDAMKQEIGIRIKKP